jgi:hypothetical protein
MYILLRGFWQVMTVVTTIHCCLGFSGYLSNLQNVVTLNRVKLYVMISNESSLASILQYLLSTMPAKKFWPSLSLNSKKKKL